MTDLRFSTTKGLLDRISLLRERAEWRRHALVKRDDRINLTRVAVELSQVENQISRIERELGLRARKIVKEMGVHPTAYFEKGHTP
jgi:hypothetical protein